MTLEAGRLSPLAKLGLLGSLYLTQGLPFGFFYQSMPLLLRQHGASLGEVGLASLLALPWALKFLWAPWVERSWHPALGRRRTWILPLQVATALVLVVLAALVPGGAMMPLLVGAVIINLLAATQDIATDGLAVDLLAAGERGVANGIQVAGYRVGMIIGGGALLVVHDRLGATVTFLAMAGMLLAASIPVVLLREAPVAVTDPTAGTPSHFFRRADAASILIVIGAYKAGESFGTGMLRPYLADAGYGLADIGWMLGTVGFVAGLLGALAGGGLVNRLGRRPALVLFGLLQAATVAGYAVLAASDPSRTAITVMCGVEHFAGGMATAALFTCMMDWSRPDSSATDYTVQASAVVIATGVAAAVSGFSASAFGFVGHFALAAGLALAAVVVVVRWFPVDAR